MNRSAKIRWTVSSLAVIAALTIGVSFSDYGVELKLDKSSVAALEKTSQLTDLSILNRVLLKISNAYVDPSRIDPNKMLGYALYAVEQYIPEVTMKFDRDIDLNPTTVEVNVKGHKKTFSIGSVHTTWETSYTLKSILSFIDQYIDVSKEEREKVQQSAINGILSTLDPHTNYLPPKNFDEIRTQTGGKFGGVGMEISPRDGRLIVVSAIPNTPAEKAGIKAKDVVVQINDQSTLNMAMADAIDLLRGEPGSTVDLYIEREGFTQPKKFTLTREYIKIESVIAKLLPDKIGYIRITNFQANTYDDFLDAYSEFINTTKGINGLVLDLRDNPGGLLAQAVKIANVFLKKGVIVSTVGLGNKRLSTEKATTSPTFADFPIVILINAGTASASEILAGALKNNHRALTIGDTSFGKGSVQILQEFSDHSALKLTIAQYLTPGDLSIQGFGITPDIQTEPVEVDKKFIDLFPPKSIVREATLSSHLTNQRAQHRDTPLYKLPYLSLPIPTNSTEPLDDFDIRLAYRLLVRSPRRKHLAPPLNPSIIQLLHEISDEQDQKIEEELRGRKIDWSNLKGDYKEKDSEAKEIPINGVAFEGSPKEEEVKGRTKSITLKLTNPNDFPLYRVYARSESGDPLLDDLEFVFGKIEPHETRSWTVEVPMDESTQGRTSEVVFHPYTGERELKGSITPLRLTITPAPNPAFAMTASLEDHSSDGFLYPGEEATLVVRVHNVGKGTSKKTRILLRTGTNSHLFLKSGRVNSFELKPDESRLFKFQFSLKKDPISSIGTAEHDPSLHISKLKIELSDGASERYMHQVISIPVSEKPIHYTATEDRVVALKELEAMPSAIQLSTDRPETSEIRPIVKVPKNSTLQRIGKVGDFSKVVILPAEEETLPLTAFLPTHDLQETSQLPDFKLKSDSLSIPSIALTADNSDPSKAKTALKAHITSDKNLKDYVLFNSYKRGDSTRYEKIAYGELSGKTADLSFELTLHRGLNIVQLQVRREDGVTSSEQIIFVRSDHSEE